MVGQYSLLCGADGPRGFRPGICDAIVMIAMALGTDFKITFIHFGKRRNWMPRIVFDTFAVQVPEGWSDITDTVEADDPPSTLAHQDGLGALQFSVALYGSGPFPDPSPSVLQDMVEKFGYERGLGEPLVVVAELGPPRLAAGSFTWGKDFLRVWQVSDGRNFALVTFICAAENAGPELEVCELIVRSITFGPA
jgi:hypothetical protein